MVATAIGSPRKQGTPSIWRASVVMRLDSMSAQCSRWTEEGRRSTTNLAPRKCLVGVCESVRIKSSLAFAPARSWPTSVRRIRVSSRQRSRSTSLRGWRSQDRGGPPFHTTRLSRYAGSLVAGPLTRATPRMLGNLPHGETW